MGFVPLDICKWNSYPSRIWLFSHFERLTSPGMLTIDFQIHNLDRMGSRRKVPIIFSDSTFASFLFDSIQACLLDHIVRMWRYCSFLDVSVEFPR